MHPISSRHSRAAARPSGLTLVELLVTISIIAILATLSLGALFSAQTEAKVMSTRAMIVKLNNLIMPRYEAYRTRRVPINISPFYTVGMSQFAVPPSAAAMTRLNALHDLMRMEMPDRWSDIFSPPNTFTSYVGPAIATGLTQATGSVAIARPAMNQAFLNAYLTTMNAIGQGYTTSGPGIYQPTDPTYLIQLQAFQGAECLYLMVTLGFVDELGGRDLFNETSIGDTDGDGFSEFHDAWGMPIRFLRWPIGFTDSELNGAGGTMQSVSATGITANFLSTANNAYVGRQLTIYNPGASPPLPALQTATVASSSYDSSSGLTTITFSAALSQTPTGTTFGIDAYPFDPRHAYPTGNTAPYSAVPFAVYPLIFSPGADKTYGIGVDTGVLTVANACYPFVFSADGTSVGSVPPSSGLYSSTDDSTYQTEIEPYGWKDNIHNHIIGLR
jgi:prepilin-type N-terminal cleavage/methylation domain-containing protein